MYSNTVLMTPELAKEWLEKYNTNNRNLRLATVRKYAEDMRGGRWQFNGEAIDISASGVLKNGQHRLYAVIEAGVPVMMYVNFDVPDEATIYDLQAKRNLADAAKFDGIDIGQKEVALCKFIYTNVMRTRCGDGQILEFSIEESESLKEAVLLCSRNKSPARKVPCYAAAWVCSKNGYDKTLIRQFFNAVGSGYYSEGEEAAIAFRNFIISRPAISSRQNRNEIFKATCKALYDYSLKKPRKLVYRNIDFDLYDCFSGSNAESIAKKYVRNKGASA